MANYRPVLNKDPQGVPIQGANDETATRIDDVGGGVSYVGKAKPGKATSIPQWQIRRLTIVGTDSVVEWADGDNKYDNVWDDRAVLSYS